MHYHLQKTGLNWKLNLPPITRQPWAFLKLMCYLLGDYCDIFTCINKVYKTWNNKFSPLESLLKRRQASCTSVQSTHSQPKNTSVILPPVHYQIKVISAHLRKPGGWPSELFWNFWVMSPWHTQILQINYQTSLKHSESFASRCICLSTVRFSRTIESYFHSVLLNATMKSGEIKKSLLHIKK